MTDKLEGHLPDCEQYSVCETCDCAEIKLQTRIVGLEEALARAVQIAENYATVYSEGKPGDWEDRADNMMWGMARDIAALNPNVIDTPQETM
jgi:hypothetical protein